MSKIGQVAAVSGSVEMPSEDGTVEIEIKPFQTQEFVEPMAEMEEAQKEDDYEAQLDAMVSLIYRALKKTEPDVTEDEVRRLPFKHFWELIDEIMEVNGLEDFTDEVNQSRLMQEAQSSQSGNPLENLPNK